MEQFGSEGLSFAYESFERIIDLFNNQLSGNNQPPAAKHVIENLPDVIVPKNANCSICLKEIFAEVAKKLPCEHFFDKDCIVKWLQQRNTCPICRFELETDDLEYEEKRREKLRAKQREAELEILHSSMYS